MNELNIRKKVVSVCLTAVLCSGCLGVGIGLGNGFAARNYRSEVLAAEEQASYQGYSSQLLMSAGNSDASTVSVVRGAADSVVSINVSGTVSYFNRNTDQTSAGSGIIFFEDDEKIYILTNHHVIESANAATISLDDNHQAPASFVGTDAAADIAVISVLKSDLAEAGISDYKIAQFGDSDKLEVGESVIAIGNAVGEGKSATHGIVSAINKQIAIDGRMLDVVQTDAAINPGNSGGALVNYDSKVVGVNTAKLAETGVEGMGYSIPANTVKKIVEDIMQNGTVQRPYLGITGGTVTEDMLKSYSQLIPGVYVSQVERNSSAARNGLRGGDIITGINGRDITSMEQLTEEISKMKPGDQVTLNIYRNGATATITADIMNANPEMNF